MKGPLHSYNFKDFLKLIHPGRKFEFRYSTVALTAGKYGVYDDLIGVLIFSKINSLESMVIKNRLNDDEDLYLKLIFHYLK